MINIPEKIKTSYMNILKKQMVLQNEFPFYLKKKVSSEKPVFHPQPDVDLSKNQGWKNEYGELENEIRLRQYSIQTLKT